MTRIAYLILSTALAGCATAEYRDSQTYRDLCGNQLLNSLEECDEGVATTTCTDMCTYSWCGDGIVNSAAGEQCEPDIDPGCRADCRLPSCGNGLVDVGEVCDSGGINTSDCDLDCTRPKCGDQILNIEAFEECDDGRLTADCDPDCTVPQCGDGLLNPEAGEECDDGGPSPACSEICTVSSCGDGYVNPAGGEECEDGNTVDGDGCTACQRTPVVVCPPRTIIPDLSTVSFLIQAAGLHDHEWGSIELDVQIDHTYMADLQMRVHRQSKFATVFEWLGAETGGPCVNRDMDARFSDTALPEVSCSNHDQPAVQGAFRSLHPMNTLFWDDQGDWGVTVTDRTQADVGHVEFCITFSP